MPGPGSLNRAEARWLGKTSRKAVMSDYEGEVITARRHREKPMDGVVIWKDKQSVGTQAGVLYCWEDAPDLTVEALRRKFIEWDDAKRPIEL